MIRPENCVKNRNILDYSDIIEFPADDPPHVPTNVRPRRQAMRRYQPNRKYYTDSMGSYEVKASSQIKKKVIFAVAIFHNYIQSYYIIISNKFF